MSADPHNPLVGKGIEADPVTPPYNQAARGEGQPPPEIMKREMHLTPRVPSPSPDGRSIVPGRPEDKRQAAIEARANRVQPGIEKDGADSANLAKLQREFDDARHNRR